MISVIRIYCLQAVLMKAGHGAPIYNAGKKNVHGKFRIFPLESKQLVTSNKSCSLNEPKQQQQRESCRRITNSCDFLFSFFIRSSILDPRSLILDSRSSILTLIFKGNHARLTSSVSYICKQVIPLIPFRSKAVKYITVSFPQIMKRRSLSMSVIDIA